MNYQIAQATQEIISQPSSAVIAGTVSDSRTIQIGALEAFLGVATVLIGVGVAWGYAKENGISD